MAFPALPPDTMAAARAFWQPFWQGLAPRERLAVALAALAVIVGLAWGLLLSPALATLRQTEQDRANLAVQAQQMQRLAGQAKALQALPKLGAAGALRALQTATAQRLGDAARLTVQGDRASVTLTRVSAAQLAQWLADARANARASVQEMRLTHDAAQNTSASASPINTPGIASPATAAAPANASPLWSGTLSLALPPS